MLKTITCIFIGSIFFATAIGMQAKKDEQRTIKYDGCYNIYESEKMPATMFQEFMVECMDNNG